MSAEEKTLGCGAWKTEQEEAQLVAYADHFLLGIFPHAYHIRGGKCCLCGAVSHPEKPGFFKTNNQEPV